MATITIRNLDEKVKRGLQVRAALNGRSMEAEARAILTEARPYMDLEPDAGKEGLGTAIHKLFAPAGGVELLAPTGRETSRRAPKFK
jgi:plasmid stability protein